MAEIIGAVSASLHLTEKVVRYCRSLRSASRDAETLADEVGAVEKGLQALRDALQQPIHHIPLPRTSSLFSAVQKCQAQLKGLETRLAPHASGTSIERLWRRVTWPLQHQDTAEAVRSLHRYVQLFHFATTLDGLVALSLPLHDTLGKLDNLQSTLESGQQQFETQLRGVVEALRTLSGIERKVTDLTRRIENLDLDRNLCRLLDGIPTLEFRDRHRNLQMTRMEGASRWILESPAFLAWRSGHSNDRTLWCNGGPGAGKTYLASVVIDDLLEVSQVADGVVLYFYFDYKKQGDQTPIKVLQTFLHQILSWHSTIPREATKLAEELEKKRGLPSWADLMALFISLCSSRSPVFIVLDALDECDAAENRAPILELIKALKLSRAQTLITSRPYPADVHKVLGDCPQVLVEASDKDIEGYVLQQIKQRIDSDDEMKEMFDDDPVLRQDIVKGVLAKSQGMFLLPALQINNILGQTNADEVRHALETLPSGLADNLTMTVERIKTHQNQSGARLAFTVLQWLSSVRRPITALELQHAIAARSGSSKLGALTNTKKFVSCCFGLTIIDKETQVVRLVHFSVNEFLLERRDELFDDPDSVLAGSCLAYMALFIKAEMRAESEWTDKSASPRYGRWPFWEYSAGHWGIHAGRSCVGPAEASLRDFAFSGETLQRWSDYMVYRSKDRTRDWRGRIRWDGASEWERLAFFITKDTTVLHVASIYGLGQVIQEALGMGFGINMRDKNGATAFMVAAGAGQNDILKYLLACGSVEANFYDASGRTALCYAVEHERVSSVRFLLGALAVDVNAGKALELACRSDEGSENADIIAPLLLAHAGLDLQAQSHEVVTKAIFGFRYNFRFDLLRKILRRPDFRTHKSSIEESEMMDFYNYWLNTDYDLDMWSNNLDRMYEVPLIISLVEKTFDRFSDSMAPRILWPFVYYAFEGFSSPCDDHSSSREVDAENDKNDADQDSISDKVLEGSDVALEIRSEWSFSKPHACDHDRRNCGVAEPSVFGIGFWDNSNGDLRRGLRTTLEAEGISFSTLDSQGRSFLHNVCEIGSSSLHKVQCLRFLLARGANVDLQDNKGRTPLHYAVSNNDEAALEIVESLISAGADPQATDKDGWTVLHSAASGSSQQILQLIVEAGAEVNATTNSGTSVLHTAAEYSKSPRSMLEYLLANGAGLDGLDRDGYTPASVSVWGQNEAMETFLELGEDPFAYSAYGNTMFLNSIWTFQNEKAQLCLACPSSDKDGSLRRIGFFGMNALDFLSQFDGSAAQSLGLGLTSDYWSTYTPTSPAIRRQHTLELVLERVIRMLSLDADGRRRVIYRTAFQLLHLGDDKGATVLFEQFLEPPSSRPRRSLFREDYECYACQRREAPLFKCRVCPDPFFCAACRDDISTRKNAYMQAKYCEGHEFLEVPGNDWENLLDGKVNTEGQTMNEFLESLKERVAKELDALAQVEEEHIHSC